MPYDVLPTALPEVLLLQPKVHGDARGFFFEAFNARDFASATGVHREFVQDNHSRSRRGVLRGLHFQRPNPQGKLVRVVQGEAFDVAVDIRRSSPNFGKWIGVRLSAEAKQLLWIPEGFAHGFLVTSDFAEIVYKVTDYWNPQCEHSLLWDQPELGIAWPLTEAPLLAAKDAAGGTLQNTELFA